MKYSNSNEILVMSMDDVVELSSQDPDADGDVQHLLAASACREASTVVTEPGRGPAIAELAVAARPLLNLRRARQRPARAGKAGQPAIRES